MPNHACCYVVSIILPSFLLSELDILPGGKRSIVCYCGSIEPQAVGDIASRHSGVLQRPKHLPGRRCLRVVGACHEPGRTPSNEGVLAKGRAGRVVKGTDGGADGNIGGMRLGEAQRTVRAHVQLLTARNFDELSSFSILESKTELSCRETYHGITTSNDGFITRRARSHHSCRTVGCRLTTEIELLASCLHGQEMDR